MGVRAPLSLGSTVGNLTHLGGGAVVVVQHAASRWRRWTAPVFSITRFWAVESIGQALLIAFGVMVGDLWRRQEHAAIHVL